MNKYVNIDALITEISDHGTRVSRGISETGREIYQLAHKHIIDLIERQARSLDELSIYGYSVSDLALVAERLRKEKVEPHVLKADNEAFSSGYKAARDDFMRSLEESINKAIERS